MGDFLIYNIKEGENSPQMKKLNKDWEVMTIYVVREINRIPWARMTIIDGDFSGLGFEISDDWFFEIGQKIRITHDDYTKEGRNAPPLFEGFIVRHSIRADVDGSSVLVVELKDPAYKLTHHRKSRVYSSGLDSDIIREIIPDELKKSEEENSGIIATDTAHKTMFQYNCTDWDFIVSRADVNGCCVLVKNGKIITKKRKEFLNYIGNADHNINYQEKTIYNFQMEMDAREQYKSVSAMSWDMEEQAITDPDKVRRGAAVCKENLSNKCGAAPGRAPFFLTDLLKTHMEEAFDAGRYDLLHPVPISRDEAKAWAEAKMHKDRLSFIEGRLRLDGKKGNDADKDIWPGEVIGIKDIATRFNGKHVVTGVRHQISENGWYVDVQFGTSSHWFAEQHDDIEDGVAAGLLPAIHGLHIGVVKNDTEKITDIKAGGCVEYSVEVAGMKQGDVISAKQIFANRDANQDIKKDDTVILGFLNNDPRQAVILGVLNNYPALRIYKASLFGKKTKKTKKTKRNG